MAKRGWLTPDSAEGTCTITVTLPAGGDWRAIFLGAILEMTFASAWEKFGEMTPQQCADVGAQILDSVSECGEGMIEDIRIEGCNLEKKVGDEWEIVGSLFSGLAVDAVGLPAGDMPTANLVDCTLTLGIPQGEQGEQGIQGIQGEQGEQGIQGIQGEQGEQGIQGVQGIQGNAGTPGSSGLPGYGLPQASEEDAICFIATQLAIYIQDDCQDFLEGIDFSTTLFIGSAVDFVDKVASFIPEYLGFGLDEGAAWVLEVAYNVTQSALDYVRENVADIEVRDIAANWIYCALKESLVVESGTVQLVNFPVNLANQAGSNLLDIPIEVDGTDINVDLGGILETLFGLPNEAMAGYVIAWFIMQEYGLNQLLGLGDGYRTMIATAYGAAEYFDSRSCAGFDPCEDITCDNFDFREEAFSEMWQVLSTACGPMGTWVSGSGYVGVQQSACFSPTARLASIRINFPEPTEVTSLSLRWAATSGGTKAIVSSNGTTVTIGTSVWTYNLNETVTYIDFFVHTNGATSPFARIEQVILNYGEESPFGIGGC